MRIGVMIASILMGIFIAGTLVVPFLLWDKTNSLMMHLLGRIIGGVGAWSESMKLYRSQLRMVGIAYVFSLFSAFFNILAIDFNISGSNIVHP